MSTAVSRWSFLLPVLSASMNCNSNSTLAAYSSQKANSLDFSRRYFLNCFSCFMVSLRSFWRLSKSPMASAWALAPICSRHVVSFFFTVSSTRMGSSSRWACHVRKAFHNSRNNASKHNLCSLTPMLWDLPFISTDVVPDAYTPDSIKMFSKPELRYFFPTMAR